MTNKVKYMQQLLKITVAASFVLTLAACGAGTKDKNAELTKLKTKIEKLKTEKNGLDAEIRQLEANLDKLDPASAAAKAKLVALQTVSTDSFSHFVDLQGKIDAENVAYVAPKNGQGGLVKAIYVNTGSKVNKGQLVMKLDDAVARQAVITAQQQIGGIKAQLSLAQSVYERQQNLWKQNIGTEVQVLNAKANVETLQSQLHSAEAAVKLAQDQAAMSNVYAEISGVIDAMNVKVGEYFSPQSAGNPATGIRIVNTGSLKIQINAPENYISRIKEGTVLNVLIPEANNKTLITKVNVVGKFIEPTTRSFIVEGKLPADKDLRANQVANVKIRDYAAANVITVPVNVVQTDEKGKYVFVAEKAGDKLVVRKRIVQVGESYNSIAEIKSGLTAGEQIITEGYQTAYEGQVVVAAKAK